MSRLTVLWMGFCLFFCAKLQANRIDETTCNSIQGMIERETREIAHTPSTHHEKLAELYTNRGESYLFNKQYEKAVQDFQNGLSHIGYFRDISTAAVIAFRATFGEVISYDNLGMHEQVQKTLAQLQTIVEYVGCNDCLENNPCLERVKPSANRLFSHHLTKPAVNTLKIRDRISACKHKKEKDSQPQGNQNNSQDNYSDIGGPNQPPEPDWCEEIVMGTATLMEGIALLAPSWAVKTTLIAVLEAFKQRALKCCQAGGFWKACVAPIVRKWGEWKNNKEKGILPNDQNLSLYIN